MTQLLEQAFAAASALSQPEQDAIAHDILQKIKSRKISRKALLKMPLESRRQILAK